MLFGSLPSIACDASTFAPYLGSGDVGVYPQLTCFNLAGFTAPVQGVPRLLPN